MLFYLYLVGIVILFILLLLTIGGSLVYFGLFEEIQVSTGKSPYNFAGQQIVYRIGRGAYSDSSTIFTEICSILPQRTTFGLYLDAPNEDTQPQSNDSSDETVPESASTSSQHQQRPLTTPELRQEYFSFSNCFNPSSATSSSTGPGVYRYLVGAILASPSDDNEEQEEERSTLTEADRKLLKSKGYSFGTLPSVDNVVHSRFPYRGIVSVVVAIRRVYPVLVQYIKDHRLCAYPAMEIYHKDSIHFLFPLAQQDQFVSLYDSNLDDLSSSDDEMSQSELEEDAQQQSKSKSKPKISLTDLEDNPKEVHDDEEEDSSTTATTSSFEEL